MSFMPYFIDMYVFASIIFFNLHPNFGQTKHPNAHYPSITLQITSFICLREKKHKKVYLSLLYPFNKYNNFLFFFSS